jgi:hypothetical protein
MKILIKGNLTANKFVSTWKNDGIRLLQPEFGLTEKDFDVVLDAGTTSIESLAIQSADVDVYVEGELAVLGKEK